jgi:transposase-like protein
VSADLEHAIGEASEANATVVMSSSNHGNGSERKPEVERRRRSVKERREIAEASLKAGVSVREVAQAYGVHPRQIGRWRRLYRSGCLGNTPAPAILAVRVTDDVQADHPSGSSKSKVHGHGMIHVEFARARVSIEGRVDAGMVRAVLECLAG